MSVDDEHSTSFANNKRFLEENASILAAPYQFEGQVAIPAGVIETALIELNRSIAKAARDSLGGIVQMKVLAHLEKKNAQNEELHRQLKRKRDAQ